MYAVSFLLSLFVVAIFYALWRGAWHGDPYDPCQLDDLCRREEDE